ncbi:MAG: hypothetical protein BWY06_02836 [Candidatus Latescibacteria bacterium ADurb.Bin168]|nr:MAG: hypothetical protein BWY06_02836 [Candidatus Latescibacteria bacterium ADurb.Bin168]
MLAPSIFTFSATAPSFTWSTETFVAELLRTAAAGVCGPSATVRSENDHVAELAVPADPIHLPDVTPRPTTYPVSGMLRVSVLPCAPVPAVTFTISSSFPPLAIWIAGEVHVNVTTPDDAVVWVEPSWVVPSLL